MTATTIRTSLDLNPDTDLDSLIGVHVLFTIEGAGGKPLTLSGRFETLRRMNFGGGMVGVGGMFVSDQPHRLGHSGRTSLFVPDGTHILFR